MRFLAVLVIASLRSCRARKGLCLVSCGLGCHLVFSARRKVSSIGSHLGILNLRFLDGAVETKRRETGEWSDVSLL